MPFRHVAASLFVLLLFGTTVYGQTITVTDICTGWDFTTIGGSQTIVFNKDASGTNDGGTVRNTYSTTDVSAGGQESTLTIIWSVSNDRWEVIWDDGTFQEILYTNSSPAAPRPPGSGWSNSVGTGGLCNDSPTFTGDIASSVVVPTVSTRVSSSITSTSATLGGNVTSDGGSTVTERGVVWGTVNHPTTANNKVSFGTGTGMFSGTVSGLPSGTTIYHRAYAINSAGTAYGLTLDFNTNAANTVPTATNLTRSKSATEGGSAVALDDIVVTDPDVGETITATLTLSNAAAGSLSTNATSFYNAGTGVWTVTGSVADVNAALAAVAFTPSADNDQNFTITTRIRDAANTGPADGAISFTVTAVNDAPTDISLSASAINENVVANSTVGTLSTTDPDAANTFTYSLVSGSGSTDNTSFNISGNSLRITNSPDYEAKNSYSVRIRTTDQGSLTYEKEFTITIVDIAEAPTATTTAADNITTTSARVNATVRDNGAATTTQFRVHVSESTVTSGSGGSVQNAASIGAGAGTTAVSYNYTSLSPGNTYYYRVEATNSSGTANGSALSFTTLPNPPAIGTASSISTTGFTINWTASTSFLVNGYRLDVATDAAFTSILSSYNNLFISGKNTVSQAVTGLTAGTQYWYRLRAENDGGASANSSTGSQTTSSVSTTVTSITRANASPTSATTVNFTVVFAASVTGVDVNDFSLDDGGGIMTAMIGTPTGSGTTWNVPVTNISGNGTLSIDFTGLTGVTPNVSAAFTAGEAYVIEAPAAPTATNLTQTKSATEGGSAFALDDIVVTDANTGETITATLTLSSAAAGSLSAGTFGSATSTFNAGTGVWTVSGSLADVNAALAAVDFTPSADNDQPFTITTRIRDAAGTGPADGTISFTVTAVNDAPVLNTGIALDYGSINEDTAAPVNGSTTGSRLVSSFTGGITDPDAGALQGIAIIDADITNGSWWFSTNGGTSWNGLGLPSNSAARLLASDARIYFQPAANYTGTISSALTIRAWDRTGGGQANITTVGTGGTTPFSTASTTISLTVATVNDAPTATNLTRSKSATEGGSAVALDDIVVTDVDAGETITATLTLSNSTAGALSFGNFGSTASTYNAGTGVWTVSGSLTDVNAALAAVAFTPSANNDQDFTISTRIRDAAGTGPADGSISFTVTGVNDAPTATNLAQNKTATEGGSAVALDDIVVTDVDAGETVTATMTLSSAAAGSLSTGTFGLATSAYNAGTGVWTVTGSLTDVNAALATVDFTPSADNDQNFTISTRIRDAANTGPADGTLSFTVTGVNDAPTLSGGPYTITGIVTGATSTGVQVSTILSGLTYADVDDNPQSGIAVTATSGAGTWQYSTDNLGWNGMGIVSTSVALKLSSTTYIRYIAGSSTETASITFKAWDRTASSSASDNTSRHLVGLTVDGGSTAFSTGNAQATIGVTPANTAPTDISLSASAINENVAAGSAVGTLSTADAEGGTMAYSLVTGSGDTDNSAFTIDGNALKISASPDYETKNNYSIRLRVTDGGLTFEKQFTISISNINDAPTLAGGPYTFAATTIGNDSQEILVSDLLDALTYSDQDAGALKGIIVTGVSETGHWRFSAGSASDWINAASRPVSATNGVLLSATDKIFYTPGPGPETATITFRAWDQTAFLPASVPGNVKLADPSTNGGSTSFSSGTATASIVVNKLSQTITFNYNSTITYGDADIDLGATASSGLTVSYESSDTNVATIVAGKLHIVKAGDVTITAKQSGNGSYLAATDVPKLLTVNKADLRVDVDTDPAITKTYNGNNTAIIAADNIVFTGLKYSDVLTATVGATYNDEHVGATKTVTINSIIVGGAKAVNYNLTATNTPTVTGSITGKPVTVTLDNDPVISKVYDKTNIAILAAGNYNLNGVEGGDAVTVSGTATYDNEGIGTGKTITVTGFVLGGADKDNYTLGTVSATTTGNITKKALTLTLDNDPVIAKVYDKTNSATLAAGNYNLIGVENGDAVTVSGTATYDTENAGTGKSVTAGAFVLAGAQKDNYSLSTVTATTTGAITAKPLSLALNATPAISKVYDKSTTATLAAGNYSLTGVETGDVVTVSGTATYDNENVGTGKTVTAGSFVLAGAQKDNYSLGNTTATTTGAITAKPITLALNPAPAISKVYDKTATATLAAGNYSLSGVESGDAVTVSGTATYDNANAGTGKTVTAGSFMLAGAQKDNYSLGTTTAATMGAITAKPLTLTLNASPAISKVYDKTATATLAAGNYSLTGIEGSDAVTVSGTATYDNENAGTGKTVTAGSFVLAGAQKDNYSLAKASATTTASITPRTLSVTASASDKVYDGTATAAVNFTDNRIAGDVLTVGHVSAVFNTKDTGLGKNITISGIGISGASAANYTVGSSATAQASVTAKALLISAEDKTRFMGQANPVFTASYSGFVTGEDAAVLSTQPQFSTTATTASPAGNYPIIVSGATAQNYSIAYANGTLTVGQSAPTAISMAAAALSENQPAGTLGGTLSSTSPDPSAVHTYSLVSGAGSADNGSFSISGNRLVTAAALDYENKSAYQVRVRSTNQYGLSLEQEFVVQLTDVNEAPTLAAIGNQVFCLDLATRTINLSGITAGPESGQNLSLSVSSDNPAIFDQLSVGPLSGNTAVLSYRMLGAGSARVTVTVKDNGGTANGGTDTYTRSFDLTANVVPGPSITSNLGLTISKGATATLTATGGGTYQWAAAQGIIGGASSSVLTVRPTQTTTYQVTVTLASGCTGTASVTITVKEDYQAVDANNFMSPDGDGVNDRLVIKNLDMYPTNEVKIYDRAGRLLYTKKNYTDEWDGTFQGVPLADDTYYYVVDFGPGRLQLKGFVTIVRAK